jgi:hypothetical protein
MPTVVPLRTHAICRCRLPDGRSGDPHVVRGPRCARGDAVTDRAGPPNVSGHQPSHGPPASNLGQASQVGQHGRGRALAPGRRIYEQVVHEAALSRAERPREGAIVRHTNRRPAVSPAHDQPLYRMVAIVQPAPHCLDLLWAQLEAVRPPIRAEQRRPLVVIAASNGRDHPGPRLREIDHALLMFRRHGGNRRARDWPRRRANSGRHLWANVGSLNGGAHQPRRHW